MDSMTMPPAGIPAATSRIARHRVSRRRARLAAVVAAVAVAVAFAPARSASVQAISANPVSAAYTVGTVSVAQPGIPGLLGPCAATTWSYTSSNMPAFAVTVNPAGTFFLWNVTMTMSVAGCENANGGAGSITGGSITGTNPVNGGTLVCTFSGGSYSRTGVVLTASIASTCNTIGVSAPVTFSLDAAWVPNLSDLQGVTAFITQATLAGTLDSTPS